MIKVLLFLFGLGLIAIILLAIWRNGLPDAMGLLVKAATGLLIAVLLMFLIKVILSLREPAEIPIDPSLRDPAPTSERSLHERRA